MGACCWRGLQPWRGGKVTRFSGRTSAAPSVKLDKESRNLSIEVPKHLRRGVQLQLAMSGLGAHWRGETLAGTGARVSGQEYALSEAVDRYHEFLSHDWATPGWMKYLSLCVIFNGRAAFAACAIVSVLVGIAETVLGFPDFLPIATTLRVGGEVHDVRMGIGAIVLGTATYQLFFFQWQTIRGTLLRFSCFVFMDKLCINQMDENQKSEGILALAGFLSMADRLVILWSPRYLTRLWCVYEVATWIYLEKDVGRAVRFMPVVLGQSLAIASILIFVQHAVTLNLPSSLLLRYLIIFAINFVILGFFVHMLRGLVQDLVRLPSQIEAFSVRQAECFCCSVNHVHPATRAGVPCDRELVFSTLERWFVHTHEGPACTREECLDTFDTFVRTQFGPQVLQQVGGSRLGYSNALFTSAAALVFSCDRIPHVLDCDLTTSLRFGLHCLWLSLGVWPCVLKITLIAAAAAHTLFPRQNHPLKTALETAAMTVVACVICSSLWLASVITLSMRNPLPQCLCTAALALVASALFRESSLALLPRRCRRILR